MANYALVEWPDNIDISDTAPSEYCPTIRTRFSDADWKSMTYFHALPNGWESLSYDEFLVERRKLMANVIRAGFEKLS